MIKLLGSIKNTFEAKLVKDLNFDITDIKNVGDGALGYVGDLSAMEISNILKGKIISVTAGNFHHPGTDEIIERLILLDKLNISYIKIGFFDKSYLQEHQYFLQSTSKYSIKKIGVLFADLEYDDEDLSKIFCLNYDGFMIDTINKSSGSSINILEKSFINSFIRICRLNNKLSGISGSLSTDNVHEVMKFNSDFVGFRGALCSGFGRDELDIMNCKALISNIKQINQKMYLEVV